MINIAYLANKWMFYLYYIIKTQLIKVFLLK